MLASGNLGLIYLMEERRRLTLEEIEERHPRLLRALREHPHIAFALVHSGGARADRARRRRASVTWTGTASRAPIHCDCSVATPPSHLIRTDTFEHAPDILVNSFYDAELEQGCAFEELISFHGGLGGPQTRPFILYPVELPMLGATDRRGRRPSTT